MNGTSKKRMTLATSGLAFVLISSLLLVGCGGTSQSNASSDANKSTASASTGKIKVVAAEDFYGEVAQAVGGDRVDVTSILTNPEQDPHDYEPTPDASKAVTDSQMVVYTGIGYDDWMDKLIQADSSSNNKSVIAVGSDLLGKQSGDNPHVWYDPTTMPKLANKIAEDLGKVDPGHAKEYQTRAQNYIHTLAAFTDKVAKLKQASPALIDASEPVFGYMADALNLKVNDPQFAKAIEDGNDPAPAQVGAVQNDIKGKNVKLFIDNLQSQSPTVDNMVKLADASGVPVVKVTETEPAGKSYVQWMTDQLDQVGKALGIQ